LSSDVNRRTEDPGAGADASGANVDPDAGKELKALMKTHSYECAQSPFADISNIIGSSLSATMGEIARNQRSARREKRRSAPVAITR